MRAEVGDELTVRGVHQGDEDRHGEIIRIDGADGARPHERYAGIDNELYTNPKTGMFFSDAKAGLAEITAAVKALVPG